MISDYTRAALKEIQEEIDKILYRLSDLNDSIICFDVDDKLIVEAKFLIQNFNTIFSKIVHKCWCGGGQE